MVPSVSPRSIRELDRAVTITVSAPGQKALVNASQADGTSVASARTRVASAISTGGGMSRPRPLASSSRCTALASKASAPMP